MKHRKKKKTFRNHYFWAVFAIVFLVAAAILYYFVSLNLWINSDAGMLQPYQRVLMREELDLTRMDPSGDSQTRLIEKALIEANAKDRIVLNLSRSDIRLNPLRTRAYVKIFLRTAIPRDRSKTTSIKSLNVLVKKDNLWRVQSTQDISIE